ncbi:MAG: hydrogenase expression/formation protein HypC [Desulfovibrionales bacterium]|jgi:hydrogenase expression/formation protein HypC|nr:hydrogenase expression/formation protein HypC [Desulfovibrionales bacterium]
MCLAVPMEVTRIDDMIADVRISGVTRQVRLEIVDRSPEVGDFVIVHAGFALRRLDREEAMETLQLFQEGFNLDFGLSE